MHGHHISWPMTLAGSVAGLLAAVAPPAPPSMSAMELGFRVVTAATSVGILTVHALKLRLDYRRKPK